MHETSDGPQGGVRWASGSSYAIIPEWVLDSEMISHAGVRLYGILARYANTDGEAYPSRGALAERMHCSTDTIDRAVADLVAAGALTIEPRQRDDGGQSSNLYVLNEAAPGAAQMPYPPLGVDAEPRTRASTSNERREENPPVIPPTTELTVAARARPANRPATVARKRVTDKEYSLAVKVLGAYNDVAGTHYTGVEWISKIVLRIREHPKIEIEGHQALIRAVFAGKHWWDGDPQPSIIYGNGGIFEKSLHIAVRPQDPNRPRTVAEHRQRIAARDAAAAAATDTIDGEAVELDG